MRKLGRKQLTVELQAPLATIPETLIPYGLELSSSGTELVYTYDTQARRTGITSLLKELAAQGIGFSDLQTSQSSLEEIFVGLVRKQP